MTRMNEIGDHIKLNFEYFENELYKQSGKSS